MSLQTDGGSGKNAESVTIADILKGKKKTGGQAPSPVVPEQTVYKKLGEIQIIDDLTDTDEDKRDIEKAKEDIPTKTDALIIKLLALLNCAAVLFLAAYFYVTGAANPYDRLKVKTSVKTAADFFDPAAVFSELTPTYETDGFPRGMRTSFMGLYSMNPDTAAWLKIPGTPVNFAVVRAEDNSKYYRTDYYGDYSVRGAIFMDYRDTLGSDSEPLSKNTIIYGHQMQSDKSVFTELQNYADVEYYKEHPVITLDTIYKRYRFKVIGAFTANVYAEDDGGNLFYFWDDWFSTGNTSGYVNEVKTRSYFVNDSVDVLPEDKFLTLQTCCYDLRYPGGSDTTEGRFVVVARLVRDGESADVDVGKARANENNRMPQRWYDINGLTNPYAETAVWQYD